MTANDIIETTLRLDAEATKGPWFSSFNHWGKCDVGRVVDPAPPDDVIYEPGQYGCSGLGLCERITRADVKPENADFIAHSRTAAPLLARMLRVAMKAVGDINRGMTLPEDDVQRAIRKRTDDALAEIERMANGGEA